MATLEKFKYYSDFFSQYISTRFGILKFSGFAIFLTLLGTTEIMNRETYGINFIFIYASLFVFRLFDDAWSFYLDRKKYAERTYLHPENFKHFIVFTAVTFIIYQSFLFLFSSMLAISILALFIASSVFYIFFFKVDSIMRIIPLFKYPVLIWCASRFSMAEETLFLAAGAFFMVLTFDFIDENRLPTSKLILKIVLCTLTGLLIFQPWIDGDNIAIKLLFIATPIIFVAFTQIKGFVFYPIIIFPILHIIDLIV